MKNKIIIGTILTTTLLTTTPVNAMGTAKVEFTNNDNIKVGDTFTIRMNVTDIKDTYDGVVSMGGNLSFDSTMIEYVSSKGTETPYLFQINEDYNYKIAGLDFTLDNGIKETLTVYEFTFKALQEGNTTITLENAKLTDSQDYIDTVVLEKKLNIEAKQETIIQEMPITNVNTKFETSATKKVVVEEVVETKTEAMEEEIKVIEENTKEFFKDEKPKLVAEKSVEKETFTEKLQKVFNNIFLKLRNLFK